MSDPTTPPTASGSQAAVSAGRAVSRAAPRLPNVASNTHVAIAIHARALPRAPIALRWRQS